MSAEPAHNGIRSIQDQEYACEAQEAVKLKFGKLGTMSLTWHSVNHGLNLESGTVLLPYVRMTIDS